MNKEILNIVVTGGPCGGKTTGLNELAKLLRSYGYTVYLVDEAATELINSGIRPFGENKFDLKTFQSLIIDTQLSKENLRKKAASLCDNKVAILYDRGILDGRGFIDDDIFNELLEERNISETDLLTRYDMVIHLVTAAIGKEEYYTTLNNTARTETALEARIKDRKILEAWRNHPNLKIVGNDTLFDEKILKIKNFIRAYLGEKEIIKQERYLVDLDDIDISKINHSMIEEKIEEFVLSYDTDEIELFSKSTINKSSYYTCSKKKSDEKATVCRTISEKEYNDYLSKSKCKPMNKVRLNFIEDKERYRLDLFSLSNESFAILERDVTDTNKKKLPSIVSKAVNITDNRNYDDDSIFIDYNIENIYNEKRKTL